MNYFEELNLFWRTGITSYLTPNASLLYLSLLDVANSRHWPEYIAQKSSILEDRTGIEKRDTLRDARAKLKQVGLISFDSKQGAKITAYKILGVENALKVLGIVPDLPKKRVTLPEVDPKLTRSEPEVDPKSGRSCEPEVNSGNGLELSQKKRKETKQKENIPPKFQPDSPEMSLALKLQSYILKNNDKARVPKDLTGWAAEFDRMLRIDGRPIDQLAAVMKFSQESSFWASNILSAKKLRDKYDTLYMQSRAQPRGHPSGDLSKPSPEDARKKELAKKLYAL